MAFKSLDGILEIITNQPEWQEQQQFRRLLKCWSEVVGATIAKQTRPLSIQRQVLRVATSSSVWAQTLTLERRRILAKLNPRLPSPLVDIRFSTAGWLNQSVKDSSSGAELNADVYQEHPSRIPDASGGIKPSSTQYPQDSHATFQRWAEKMQWRSQSLPLCPQCQCPTPPGELQRWSVCAPCATKSWSNSQRSPLDESAPYVDSQLPCDPSA